MPTLFQRACHDTKIRPDSHSIAKCAHWPAELDAGLACGGSHFFWLTISMGAGRTVRREAQSHSPLGPQPRPVHDCGMALCALCSSGSRFLHHQPPRLPLIPLAAPSRPARSPPPPQRQASCTLPRRDLARNPTRIAPLRPPSSPSMPLRSACLPKARSPRGCMLGPAPMFGSSRHASNLHSRSA